MSDEAHTYPCMHCENLTEEECSSCGDPVCVDCAVEDDNGYYSCQECK